jgi:CBS domain-containing protein
VNEISHILARKGPHVHAIDPQATVAQAVEVMNELHIGSLVVIEGDELVGIFTERDVLRRVVAACVDPRTTPVANVMTRDLITVEPLTSIAIAMSLITEHRCRHLPVVDGGRLVGLVSSGDLTAWLVSDQQQTIWDLYFYITH